MKNLYFLASIAFIALFTSCGNNKSKQESKEQPKEVFVPQFNSDSAYAYVKKQVEFGPRVPNSKNHTETGNYLIEKLKSFNWEVQEQNFEATTFDNQLLYLRNIIASYNPKKSKRILLAAHWDTRPFADKDNDRIEEPILGANDGASGVGVLLEIARVINTYDSLNLGVDIIFFDGEDWGERPNEYIQPTNGLESWWCLGSQYWSKNKHEPKYSAYYGILLDMVGGENAKFYKEGYSMSFAPSIVNKVWSKGAEIGHSSFFINQPGGQITDDHYFVNKYAKIPMIDIIPMDPTDGSFGAFHHTHDDNMDIISKLTLKAVGETVLHVLYNE
ncbi:MAG: M28 family peptidase [Fulvivirga sp.]|uniref:M28 family peptidase n=1 Tax=Fulvivirga sp. TaxID=1931237 RepID=UPI0032EEF76B